MIYTISFSPTGGTQRVAEALSGAWETEKKSIDLTEAKEQYSRYRFSESDICVVAVPSYGGRVPAPAAERLSQMSGGGCAAVAAVAYGNRDYDDTLLELKETLTKAGFCVTAMVTAVAEHSVVREIASGRPDSLDMEELKKFALRIQEKLETGERGLSTAPKGGHPYREYRGIPLKPRAGRGCTLCGLCASKCPAGAIPKENPRAVDKEACISCMRCIQLCPSHARKVSGLMLKAAAGKLKKQCARRKENTCAL